MLVRAHNVRIAANVAYTCFMNANVSYFFARFALALMCAALLLGQPANARTHEHRSREAKRVFERGTGHPHGWPGHVVDHIIPLACGGADAPGNMQWQTVSDGKAKDKWERKGCTRRAKHYR